MNYAGNLPDWHQYSNVTSQTGGTEGGPVSNVQNASANSHFPFMPPPPGIGAVGFNGMGLRNDGGLGKCQNDANYGPRNYQTLAGSLPPAAAAAAGPPPPAAPSNPSTNSSGNPSLSSLMHMSSCCGHYVNNSVNTRDTSTDDIGYRASQVPLSRSLNATSLNVNPTPLGAIIPRGHHGHVGSIPTTHSQTSCVGCKAPYCNLDPGMTYDHWDHKFNGYPRPGFPNESRRYANESVKKDSFEMKDTGLMATNAFNIDNSHYKYRKDQARSYPTLPPNYPMQNYNFPMDYQKYHYGLKPAGNQNNKYQEPNPVVSKYNKSVYQNHPPAMMQKSMIPPIPSAVDLTAQSQNSYYNNTNTNTNNNNNNNTNNNNNNNGNSQFPRNLPNEFNRECHMSLDKMQNNSGNNNNNSNNNNNNNVNIHHSTYQRYHLYQQKIAMERFAMENHLREFTRIPGYQSHPKYKACMHRYRELVKSHQAIEYQNSLQDSAPRVTPPGVISPINLQFDQNGHLINSQNYLHNSNFPKVNATNPVSHPAAESERNLDHQSKMLPIRQSNNQELPPNSSLQATLPVTSESQFVPGTNAPTERQASRDVHEDSDVTQKKNANEKPNIDVRQFLANWDESEEEENNHAEAPVVVVATFPDTLDGGNNKDGGQRLDESGNLNLKEFASSFNKGQVVKPGSIIHCITNGLDEVPTIHIVDEFESNISKMTSADMVVDGSQTEGISFFDRGSKNVHATVKVAVPETPEGSKKQQVESNTSETNSFSKTFQKNNDNGSGGNLKNSADSVRKQNSFEESHNPDDISLPDLPMSECTPISTTLNTPIHSDGEESSERVEILPSLPSNPIELIPNSPMISFSHSPMKIDGYENLKRKESASRLEFGFDQIDEGVGKKKKKFAGEGEMNFDIVHRSSKKNKDDNASKEREKDAEIWISSNKEPGNADKFLIDTSQTSRNLSQKCLNVVNVAFEDIPPENQDIEQASRKDKLLSDTIENNSMDAVKQSAAGTSQVIFELSENQQNLDTNLLLEREGIYSSNTGEENFSSTLGMMPLIPGEDNEEPKIPVPPMEDNCLTKIIKNTLPLTNVNVLESSDDDKLEKEDDIWREVRYINKSPENSKSGKSKSNEINASALTSKLSDLRDSLISNNENSIDANFADKLFSNSEILQPLESSSETQQAGSSSGKDRMKSLKEYRKSKRKDEEEESLLPLVLPSCEKPKKSDFEIQVTNVNFKIKDNDVRKELLMMRAKNDDTRESIKIEINLSRSDKSLANFDSDQVDLVPVGRRKSSTSENIEEDTPQKRTKSSRALGKTCVNLIDTTIRDPGSKEEGFASTRRKSVTADEEPAQTSISETTQRLKHLESKKLYSFDINPGNADDSCLTDSFDRHDTNVDFQDFDVDSLASYDKDKVDDSPNNRRYYKTALRYKNCEIYKNPDNFHTPSPSNVVPATTSPESSVDMDTVPVYTTKDGKIKYSPNPKYTYRLLLKEARDWDGSRFSSSRGHRKSEQKKARKKRKADFAKKYGESSRVKNPSPPLESPSPVPTGYFNPWDEKDKFLDYRKKSNERRSGSVESEFLKCNPTAFAYLDKQNNLGKKESTIHDFYNNDEDSLESVRTYASHVHEFPKHSTFRNVLLADHRETKKRDREDCRKEKHQGKEKNSSLHVSSSTKDLPDPESIGNKMLMCQKVKEIVRVADSTSDVHPKSGKSSIDNKELQIEAETRDKDIGSLSRSIGSENRELRSIAYKLNALIDLQSIKALNERFLIEERKALNCSVVEEEFRVGLDVSKGQGSCDPGVRVTLEAKEEEENLRADLETRNEEKLEKIDVRIEGLPILDDHEGEEGLFPEKEINSPQVNSVPKEENGQLEQIKISANPIAEKIEEKSEEKIEKGEEDREEGRFPAQGEKEDFQGSKREGIQLTIVEKSDSETDPNLRLEAESVEEESKIDIPNTKTDLPEDSIIKEDTSSEQCESSKVDADLFEEKPNDLKNVEGQFQMNSVENLPNSGENLNNAEEERSIEIQEPVPEQIINEENVLEDSEYLSAGEKNEIGEIDEKIVPDHYVVPTDEISGDCSELDDSGVKMDFNIEEEEKSFEFPAEASLENHEEEDERKEKEMPRLVPTEPRTEMEEVSSRLGNFDEISDNSKVPLLPKIPKILIKNARSRPTTPTIEEIPEPKNSKTVKPKQLKMIPKMKINLEDKFPKVVVKEEETKKKIVPKVKIRKIKRRSSEEKDESPPPRLSPKLILCQDVDSDENDSKERINELPELEDNSCFSALEEKMVPKLIIKKTEKNLLEDRRRVEDVQNSAKKLKKEEKEHNLLSEKIPKVIIKRTIASAEFKYEISKDKKEALTKIAKWQPEVKLQRYEALDTFARELKDKKNHPTRFRWSRSLNELSWNCDAESRNVKLSSSDSSRIVKLSRSNSTSCLSPSRSKHRRLSDYDAREFDLAKECRKNSKDRDSRREKETDSKTKIESEGRRRRSSRDKFERSNPDDISEDTIAETVVPPRIVENYDNFHQIFGKGSNRDENSLGMDTSKEEMSEKLDSIIKVESSDDSQSTIEILVASPTEEIEIPTCGIDSENGRLFPEEAIPAELELELANDGSVSGSLSCPKDEKREKSSSGSVPVEKTGARSERSKSSRDRTAHRSSKKLCCSDSLVKEVLAAKETLRRCLSKSKDEKTIRPKTAAEKKQGSSFDLSYLQKLPKVSNAESALHDARFNTKQGKSTDIETKTERPNKDDRKSRSKVSMNHRSTISLKNFKRHLSNEEKIVRSNQMASSEKNVAKDGNSLGNYKIPKISSRQKKETHCETDVEKEKEKEKILEKKSKEDNMPILEPQVEVTVNFQAEADRDTSRSPPVITNQDSVENRDDCTNNAKNHESQLNVEDDVEKGKVIEKDAADTSVADIVIQLAYHEKATIKHRRYCTLCERWFPTTARHQRHLAGYQHKYMELTQRRTIHALFLLFTGNPCPRLASGNVLRTDCALGELTPLQLAVQDIAISLDKSRENVVKEEDDKKN